MNRVRVVRVVAATILSAILALVATPAAAQTQIGTLRGKVVDTDGKPVADAQLAFDYVGPYKIHLTAKTNAKGPLNRRPTSNRGPTPTEPPHHSASVLTTTPPSIGPRVRSCA